MRRNRARTSMVTLGFAYIFLGFEYTLIRVVLILGCGGIRGRCRFEIASGESRLTDNLVMDSIVNSQVDELFSVEKCCRF